MYGATDSLSSMGPQSHTVPKEYEETALKSHTLLAEYGVTALKSCEHTKEYGTTALKSHRIPLNTLSITNGFSIVCRFLLNMVVSPMSN